MARLEVVPFPSASPQEVWHGSKQKAKSRPVHDARPQTAAAAPILGRIGIFLWPLDGRACLASSVVVGNRYLDFSLRRFMGSWETLLASEDTFFGRVGTARRSFCPDSLPAII